MRKLLSGAAALALVGGSAGAAERSVEGKLAPQAEESVLVEGELSQLESEQAVLDPTDPGISDVPLSFSEETEFYRQHQRVERSSLVEGDDVLVTFEPSESGPARALRVEVIEIPQPLGEPESAPAAPEDAAGAFDVGPGEQQDVGEADTLGIDDDAGQLQRGM